MGLAPPGAANHAVRVPVTDRKRYLEHLAEREAQEYASTKRLNPHPNVSGMIGERVLAEYFGAEQDLRDFPGGDKGIDLQLLMRVREREQWITVDSKATTYHGRDAWLFVTPKVIKPKTIYVHVEAWEEEDRGECRGWMWGQRIMQMPADTYARPDSVTHRWPVALLNPMTELRERMLAWRHKEAER